MDILFLLWIIEFCRMMAVNSEMIISLWPEWGRCSASPAATSSNLLYLFHPVLILNKIVAYINFKNNWKFNWICAGERAARMRGWPAWVLTTGESPSRRGSWWPATSKLVMTLTIILKRKTERKHKCFIFTQLTWKINEILNILCWWRHNKSVLV